NYLYGDVTAYAPVKKTTEVTKQSEYYSLGLMLYCLFYRRHLYDENLLNGLFSTDEALQKSDFLRLRETIQCIRTMKDVNEFLENDEIQSEMPFYRSEDSKEIKENTI